MGGGARRPYRLYRSVSPAPDEAATFGETYDGTGRLLMPALYNAHAHAPMTLLRGYAENLPLQRLARGEVLPLRGQNDR